MSDVSSLKDFYPDEEGSEPEVEPVVAKSSEKKRGASRNSSDVKATNKKKAKK